MLQLQVSPAGRHNCAAGNHSHVVFRLEDFNLANTVQALCEGRGEFFRHVLHDAGAHARQHLEYRFQCMRAAR
jgi:hypothetical protein